MLFIEYPKCTTCIKAKKWLEDNGVEFIDRNIKLDNPTIEELREWVKLSSRSLNKVFNTSGLLYKEYNLKDKLALMSDEEKLELLSTNGLLVKRPIVVEKDYVLFGFKEEEWKSFILKR